LPKPRISVVQYLNTAPLVWGFTHGPLKGKYDLSFTVPSQCAEALRTGAVDIAIIPAIEYQRIDDLVILPDLAIASKRRVRSLLLISKAPISKARSIALDRSSRSTQALTKILCARHWKIAPEFFEMPPDLDAMLRKADAALLIGDPALRVSLATKPHAAANVGAAAARSEARPYRSAERGDSARHGEIRDGDIAAGGAETCDAATLGVAGGGTLHVYDIVGQWRALTGLAAVLAVWAARPAVATPDVVADFHTSRAFGLQHLDELCAESATELKLPAQALRTYLMDNIDFTLDQENRAGLAAYFAEAAALKLIPAAKPVTVAPGPLARFLEADAAAFAKPR
jgi:chorismate dehydratase